MLNKIYSYLLIGSALLLSACSSTQKNEEVAIIPTPLSIEMGSSEFQFDKVSTIGVSDESLKPAAEYLASIFKGAVTFSVEQDNSKADITLALKEIDQNKETYVLEINPKQIKIESASYSGIISAISSVRQLLPIEIENPTPDLVVTLPSTVIKDTPRLSWRGMMLDSSRHFWTKEEVKSILDLMAMYKLNKFHWHLTDDQGWRIEIKQYPLLTEKGAYRKFNSHDRECISNITKMDNPDYTIPEDRIQVIHGDTIYGGFYTQEDIKEIVAYAGQRGIDVIPEVDMPGHFMAAIGEYPELACKGLIGWGEVFSSPICPGKDATLEFCKNVYREVFQLFPYEFVHMGGDEVDQSNWKKCTDCQKRIKEEGLASEKELQAWFVREMEAFFKENGKRFIGWDEVLNDGLSEQATIMWWRSWSPEAIPTATSEGKNVINTENVYLYFDYLQDNKTMGKLLGYNPVPDDITPEQKALILGVQANVWAEWIPSIERLQYMITPRILALSEIAWTEPSKIPSLSEFYSLILPQIKRMDIMGINYRIPDLEGFYNVNTFVDETTLNLTCPLPNTEIRYTTDGTIPNKNSQLYEGPLTVTETTNFTFRTFRPNGSASDFVETKFMKMPYREAVDVESTSEGLKAVWYDYAGSECEKVDTAKKMGEYEISTVSIPEGVSGNIGLVITGYIEVPTDDIYTFALLSDDGSIMKIGEDLVVDNDGAHSPKEIVSQVALKRGLHPIEIRYFDNNGGMLEMYMINKNGEKTIIDKSWLKH